MTYKGWSVANLKERFTISDDGYLLSKRTGLPVGRLKGKRGTLFIIVNHPVTEKRADLSCARIAYMIQTGECVADNMNVSCKDGDAYNLRLSNLAVVERGSNAFSGVVEKMIVATEIDGILYNKQNETYIVRRGPSQSVFRSFSLAECVAVLKRWKSDPDLNEWDFTMPVAYR